MSPRELDYAIKAKQQYEQGRYEAEYRMQYEVERFQAVLLLNPYLAKKDKIKDPRELIRFSWEEEVKMSVEAMKSIMLGLAIKTKGNKKLSAEEIAKIKNKR